MGSLYNAFKKVSYDFLDVVTMGKGIPTTINNYKIKLPTRHFRLFPADYEHSSFEFYKKNTPPDSTVLDIGAHIGVFSVFFSKYLKAKVFSFEPTPSTVAVLRKTIEINHCNDKVTVVPSAVSGKSGKATFFISKTTDISVANSLIGYEDGVIDNRDGSYEVNMVSIDDFVKERAIKPNVLKIDAEGVELDLLKGAAETFRTCRPVGTLGLHPFAYQDKKEMLGEIWDLLKVYRMKVFFEGAPITREAFVNRQDHVFDVELLPE